MVSLDPAAGLGRWPRSFEQLVVASLVIPLSMVVLDVLVDDEAEVALAERNDPVEALFFDGPHEPLGIVIGRTPPLFMISRNPRVSSGLRS